MEKKIGGVERRDRHSTKEIEEITNPGLRDAAQRMKRIGDQNKRRTEDQTADFRTSTSSPPEEETSSPTAAAGSLSRARAYFRSALRALGVIPKSSK